MVVADNHDGALLLLCFWSNLNLEYCLFHGEFEVRTTSHNRVNPHVTAGLGMKPVGRLLTSTIFFLCPRSWKKKFSSTTPAQVSLLTVLRRKREKT